jgi:hypothetical protein
MESEVASGTASARAPSGGPASDGGPAIQVVDLVKRFDEVEAVRG